MRRGPISLSYFGQTSKRATRVIIRHVPLESVAIVDGARRRARCAWLGLCLFKAWMALQVAQEIDAECPAGYPRVRVRVFWVARAKFFVDCVRAPARSEERQRRTSSQWASALARSYFYCPRGRARVAHTHSHGLNLHRGLSRKSCEASACAAHLLVGTLQQQFTRAPRGRVLLDSFAALL